ncbi:MAG: malate dehydrogenase [Alphaproteobacteria bacterium]|nr:malate dehydrogenase [Alphaproteobacteria bacterium]
MKRRKIGLVGAGQIGGTLAHLIGLKDLGDVALVDIAAGMAKGKALDIQQSLAVSGHDCRLEGGDDYNLLKGCDAVIVTAGIPRKPGMSRDDLLKINAGVIKTTAAHIKAQCPNAFVIVITNPLDIMVWLMHQASGLPSTHVVGMAGVLDSARYKTFLAQELGVSVQSIDAFVLGGHGDAMVPMPSYTTISGIPLSDFVKRGKISQASLDALIDRTRNGGAEIVNLLQTGSAFYAPANSAIEMLESYFFDEKKVLPCAVHVKDGYGVKDMYVGVPCVIGSKGVEEIVELELSASENAAFQQSAKAVEGLIADLKRLEI